MRNTKIKLLIKHQNGAEVTETERTVWADRKNVTRAEFYAAYQVGLNPRYTFEISARDWNHPGDEPVALEYNGRRYNIIRTYEKFDVMEVIVGN